MNEKKQENKGPGSPLANWMKTVTEFWGPMSRMWPSASEICGKPTTSKKGDKSRPQESWESTLKTYQALSSVMSEQGDTEAFFKVINALPKILWNIAQTVWDDFFYLQKQHQDAFKEWNELHEKEFRQLLNIHQLGMPWFYPEKVNKAVDKFNVFQASVSEFLYLFYLPMEKLFKDIQNKLKELADEGKPSVNSRGYYQMWIKILEELYMTLFKSSEYTQVVGKILVSMREFMAARQEFLQDILNMFQEREILVAAHAAELEGMVEELKKQIQERKQAEEALRESEKRYRELSITDDLTKLHNSRHFFSQLKAEISRSVRYSRPLSLLLLDIDNFKHYNDRYGHLEGDKVLAKIGEVLLESLRETDSAYRYGGEELMVILPETMSKEATNIAERIRERFETETFYPTSDKPVHVTVSIGVAQYICEEELTVFIKRADNAMYFAKGKGKNRVFFLR